MKLLSLRSVCRSHVCPLAVMHVFVCSRRVISTSVMSLRSPCGSVVRWLIGVCDICRLVFTVLHTPNHSCCLPFRAASGFHKLPRRP